MAKTNCPDCGHELIAVGDRMECSNHCASSRRTGPSPYCNDGAIDAGKVQLLPNPEKTLEELRLHPAPNCP